MPEPEFARKLPTYEEEEQQMSLVEARRVLGLKSSFDESSLKASFRSRMLTAHPDKGGTQVMFQRLKEAQRILLSNLPKNQKIRFKNFNFLFVNI